MKHVAINLAELTSSPPVESGKHRVYRPIQYLGNKLRSIDLIEKTVVEMGISSETCFDLFSGTSVVSQALAGLNNKITAVDAQSYCGVMGSTMLGEGRARDEKMTSDILGFLKRFSSEYVYREHWRSWVEREDDAIERQDAKALAELNMVVPVWWRHPSPGRAAFDFQKCTGREAFGVAPLITGIYAGTYFGVRQCLAVDALRSGIEKLWKQKRITRWQRNACLTALMAACSKAAYSAGKHFAQPLTSGKAGSGFRLSRLIEDRAIDIESHFAQSLEVINLKARSGSEGHSFKCMTVETSLAEIARTRPRLVYADPPYTAQQYSRFYHLLETITVYRIPQLLHHGRVTSGLYPVDRYKSAFCSKRKAKVALSTLVKAVHSAGSILLLSYSASRSGSDGNARMIDADGLLAECSAHYGARSVTVHTLGHSYRQFNSSMLENSDRADPEILICCRG